MQIKFKRKAKSCWSDSSFATVKVASRWAAARLGFTKLPITIVIRLVGPHPSEFGSCSMMEEDRFIIWLQGGVCIDRTISTLFHEMTHVRQHLFEGLVLHTHDRIEYQGTKHHVEDYWASPWEREARKNEFKLLREFMEVY